MVGRPPIERSINSQEDTWKRDVQKAIPPAGSILLWAGSGDPVGWMVCDGRALDRSQQSTLFKEIGTTYGGTGSSFNIPNLTSYPVGAVGKWIIKI